MAEEAAAGDSLDATLAATHSGAFGDTTARRPKLKKPGAKWDGRYSSLSLEEYRAMKWGLDAGYRSSLRNGPKWSCRPSLRKPLRTQSDGNLPIDPIKAASKLTAGPSFTMGLVNIGGTIKDSPGPQYKVSSIMDPEAHPTVPKNQGARFGTETVVVLDEDAPAPGQYSVDNYTKSGRYKAAPIWNMQGREAFQDPAKAPTAGPGEYKFEHSMRTGKITPFKWTMQGKTEPLKQPRGERRVEKPGPPHYNPPGVGGTDLYPDIPKPPKWSFSGGSSRGLLPE
eukprot:TRINITY_DN1839_c3_g1_i1.p1 TRINITY_DN1839_c3_g1~~TRINITY_DN1839_c3_g1_i1.p1  ORF type:complete len:282 (+),score=55.42 TRINITY_DN1839_c3_g1_i1:51-896(+)